MPRICKTAPKGSTFPCFGTRAQPWHGSSAPVSTSPRHSPPPRCGHAAQSTRRPTTPSPRRSATS
eukprot:203891-Prorocentrum_lima.AAC.1